MSPGKQQGSKRPAAKVCLAVWQAALQQPCVPLLFPSPTPPNPATHVKLVPGSRSEMTTVRAVNLVLYVYWYWLLEATLVQLMG